MAWDAVLVLRGRRFTVMERCGALDRMPSTCCSKTCSMWLSSHCLVVYHQHQSIGRHEIKFEMEDRMMVDEEYLSCFSSGGTIPSVFPGLSESFVAPVVTSLGNKSPIRSLVSSTTLDCFVVLQARDLFRLAVVTLTLPCCNCWSSSSATTGCRISRRHSESKSITSSSSDKSMIFEVVKHKG